MKIFIDEKKQIFCEYREGIWTKISKKEYERLKKENLIIDIEVALWDIK